MDARALPDGPGGALPLVGSDHGAGGQPRLHRPQPHGRRQRVHRHRRLRKRDGGTIAGILLTDLLQGRANPWADLYDPGRITLRAAKEYAAELAKSNAPFGQWVTPGEVSSVSEIPPGEGGILRRGLHKIAVYRDPMGAVIELSAVCRHLGCIVEWNTSEKTWDCPCHGSRYAPDGRVLNGPARTDLPRAE
jgi:Rieske Fe-S protein